MGFENICVTFREYDDFSFMGNPGNYSVSNKKKKFPFIGKRAYTDDALAIMEKFQFLEFDFLDELKTSTQKSQFKNSYKYKNGWYKLIDSVKSNKSKMKELWALFQETSHFSKYYKCLPYLKPDINESIKIKEKYIYIFRQDTKYEYPTIFREYQAKSDGKYYEAEMAVLRNDQNKIIQYYFEDHRGYKSPGTDTICLPIVEGHSEYDYLFVLSKVKLCVKRISKILEEMRAKSCNRVKRISLYKNQTQYNKETDIRIKNIKTEAEKAKNVFESEYKKFFVKFPKVEKEDKYLLVPLIKKTDPLTEYYYSDILYNAKADDKKNEASHIIFLTDHMDHVNRLKKNLETAQQEHQKFLEKKENGFMMSDLRTLNTLVEGVLRNNSKDSSDAMKFKEGLKDKMKVTNGEYYYLKWKNDYDKILKQKIKAIEYWGTQFTASIDNEEYTSIHSDYYFCRLNTDKTQKDKDESLLEDFTVMSGSHIFMLYQCSSGKVLLKKLTEKAKEGLSNLTQALDTNQQYERFAKKGDWISLALSTKYRKYTCGVAAIFQAYGLNAEMTYFHASKLLGIQNIKIKKRNSKTSQLNMLAAAKKKAMSYGRRQMAQYGGYRTISRKGKTIEVEVYLDTWELDFTKTQKAVFKTQLAIDVLTFGFQTFNLVTALKQYNRANDKSMLSAESIACMGAIWDTFFSLYSAAGTLGTVTGSKALSLFSMTTKQIQIVNIISSTFDYFASAQSTQVAIKDNDYDSAVFHGLSAVAALASIGAAMYAISACIAAGTSIGATGGAIGGAGIGAVPGAIIGFVVGLIAGIAYGVFSYIAAKLRDNKYERWFNHCYWGDSYGSGSGTLPGYNVRYDKWDDNPQGIIYQFKGFYHLFYNFTAELIFSEESGYTEIGIKILPSLLDAKSYFKVSAWIFESENAKAGDVRQNIEVNMELIYLPPVQTGYNTFRTQKGVNCSRLGKIIEKDGEATGYDIESISVVWTDHIYYNKNVSSKNYEKNITKWLNEADDGSWRDPYLYIRVELDISGDGKYTISNTYKFKLDR